MRRLNGSGRRIGYSTAYLLLWKSVKKGRNSSAVTRPYSRRVFGGIHLRLIVSRKVSGGVPALKTGDHRDAASSPTHVAARTRQWDERSFRDLSRRSRRVSSRVVCRAWYRADHDARVLDVQREKDEDRAAWIRGGAEPARREAPFTAFQSTDRERAMATVSEFFQIPKIQYATEQRFFVG